MTLVSIESWVLGLWALIGFYLFFFDQGKFSRILENKDLRFQTGDIRLEA